MAEAIRRSLGDDCTMTVENVTKEPAAEICKNDEATDKAVKEAIRLSLEGIKDEATEKAVKEAIRLSTADVDEAADLAVNEAIRRSLEDKEASNSDEFVVEKEESVAAEDAKPKAVDQDTATDEPDIVVEPEQLQGSKKPLTGFMLFSKEHVEKVKEDNPECGFGQIGKKLGAMWRELSDDEKQAYKDGKSGAAAEEASEVEVKCESEADEASEVEVNCEPEADEESFSDCHDHHDEDDMSVYTEEDFEAAVEDVPEHPDESKPSPKSSPKKEKTHSFSDDASGDIATFVGETLDRMADAIEELNNEDGAKIVDGEEEEDNDSNSDSSGDWSVVDEEMRIARSVEALGSALFNSDLRSAEELQASAQVSAVSALTHGSGSSSVDVSSATSVPTTIRSLPQGTDVSPVQLDRWASQLTQLHELGFLNDALSVDVLETLAAANIGVDSDEEVTVQQVIDTMMKDW